MPGLPVSGLGSSHPRNHFACCREFIHRAHMTQLLRAERFAGEICRHLAGLFGGLTVLLGGRIC